MKDKISKYLLGPEQALSPQFLLSSITAGLILGVLAVFIQLSFATMIFSGALTDYLQFGIGYFLAGAVIVTVGMSLLGSFRGTIALPQDVPTVILAFMAAELASQMMRAVSVEQLLSNETLITQVTDAGFITITVAIMLTTILVGLLFIVMGALKLGGLIRFVPYPVIGGFLAGTGWLVVKGGFSVITPLPLSWDSIPKLMAPDSLVSWLPAMLFALVLLIASRKLRHFLIIPGLLVLGIVVSYAWIALTNTSGEAAHALGLFLGPFPEGGFWQPVSIDMLALVEWKTMISHQPGYMGTLILLSLISMLLNTSGIELSAGRDLRLNRDLISSGLTNLVAGISGSPAGYPALSFTVLGIKLNAASRLLGLIVASVILVALIWGDVILGMFPRAVIAGLLIFLGLSLLFEWLYEKWFTLSRTEYFIVLLIVLCIAFYGIEIGILVGVMAAVSMFVVRYSLNNPINQTMTGAMLESTVERSETQQELLRSQGEHIYALKLQGFLFFGTSHMIYKNLQQRLRDHEQRLDYLILDFAQVSDMDSSSEMSFLKIAQQAEIGGFQMLLVELRPKLRMRLRNLLVEFSRTHTLEKLDDAVRWYEDELLGSDTEDGFSFDAELKRIFPDQVIRSQFMELLEHQTIETGEVLIRQGSPAEHIFFLQTGQLEILSEKENGSSIRLRTILPGAMFGELAIYLEQPRSATVKAATQCTLFSLRNTTFINLWNSHPELAMHLNQHLLKTLAQRLVQTSSLIE